MVAYKEYVKKDEIAIDVTESEGNKFRFSMKIPFDRGGNKVALVVMMNPSKADSDNSDPTVNNVLTRIYNECPDVAAVVITNLYPLYETYSSSLALHEQQSTINLQKIHETLAFVDFALLGWGKPQNTTAEKLKEMKYHEHAHRVVKMLQKANLSAYKVGELREGLYPKHLGRSPFATLMSELNIKALSDKLART